MNRMQDLSYRRQCGFTLLELGIVVVIVGILATLALPALLTARKSANEAQAISALRSITNAQEMFYRRTGNYGTLSELVASGDLDATFDPVGTRRGYQFADEDVPDEATWSVSANPDNHGVTGDRFFYIDTSGVIRYSESGIADDSAEPVQ